MLLRLENLRSLMVILFMFHIFGNIFLKFLHPDSLSRYLNWVASCQVQSKSLNYVELATIHKEGAHQSITSMYSWLMGIALSIITNFIFKKSKDRNSNHLIWTALNNSVFNFTPFNMQVLFLLKFRARSLGFLIKIF